MNAIVVYTSKTGFTKRYAEWIAEELHCEAAAFNKKSIKSLDRYELIIYGGGITANTINGLSALKKLRAYNEKKVIVFATGATPEKAVNTINQIRDKNFPEQEKARIPFFFMQGGINYERMGFMGRTVMHFMHSILSKKSNRTEEETEMMNALAASYDASDRSYIKPVLEYIQK